VFLACYERLSKSYDQDVRAEFDKTKQPQMRVAEYVSNVVQMELFYIYIYIYIYIYARSANRSFATSGWLASHAGI
jgi:hypothetical protein